MTFTVKTHVPILSTSVAVTLQLAGVVAPVFCQTPAAKVNPVISARVRLMSATVGYPSVMFTAWPSIVIVAG